MCDYREIDAETIKRILAVSTINNTITTTSNLPPPQIIQNNRGL